MVAKLETTLREACVLVSSCQASSYFRRFIRSGKQAEQFQRIKDKIDFYLQLFPVISHIDTTRRLNILLDGVESPQTQQGRLQGLPVAIKRCFIESSPERLSDFENEIKFIPRLQHRNIVKLQGYCIQGKERILVYEYMRNKSLDKFIFGQRYRESLSWDRLFAIIGGIAQGVVYTGREQAWDLVFVEKTLWKLLVHPSLCSEALRRMDQNHQIRRCAHIALVCVQEDPADRPSMWEVVLMLSTTARLETPKKPVRQYGSEPRSGDILRDTRDWYKKTITVVLRQVT
ncbi:hypothetical protein ACQ4PT_059607 [Festuca glaucescens]